MRENIRIGFFEEWPSLRATKVMPYLTTRFRITYVTSEKGEMPQGEFERVIKYPAPRYINQRGLAFSRLAKQLYRKGEIDFAVHYAGIAFMARNMPIIDFMGGSNFTDFKQQWSKGGLLKKLRLSIGLLHYTVPEYIGCKNASRIVVNSDALKNDLANNYKIADRVFSTVHNGVDNDFLSLGAAKVISSTPKLLFAGRLHFMKGILEVVTEFTKRQIDAEFLIAGEGPDAQALQRLCQGDSRIRLLGHISKPELLEVMKTTNIFVFPSYHEGCPNSLLESMASRHACVCYDILPVKEVLWDSGRLIPIGNPVTLCDNVEDLVTKPGELARLAAAAHERAKSFTWEKCAKSVEKVFLDFANTL